MPWDDGLLPQQKTAAGHAGRHARLLAGPGTGKTLTLTRHACFLVEMQGVAASSILAVTFTRAAARELRQRVEKELGPENSPRVSTLHSFALRQLLKNSARILELPKPVRIADDWEERHIILEDLKLLLELARISEARDLLNELSADWQSLIIDDAEWEKRFPDPRFLGLWREHRQVYGYTLRAELVYRLKKVLEQRGDFELEGDLQHLLVDEYQDLNRCDLAVVQQFASRGVELYVAGDDDQSIYGFRMAHPEGIRRFPRDYTGAREFSLEVCKRCDEQILKLGLFVAEQDFRRESKTIKAESGKGQGEVAILRFRDQDEEASGVAHLCAHLVTRHQLPPDDILILLRSDHKRVFSALIRKHIERAHVPVAAPKTISPLDDESGRTLLTFLRLAARREDSLAWRTLLEIWCSGVGSGAVGALYDVARSRGVSFAQALLAAHSDASILPNKHRTRIPAAVQNVLEKLDELFPGDSQEEHKTPDELMEIVRTAGESLIRDAETREAVLQEFERVAEAADTTSIEQLVRATEVMSEDIEQEVEQGKVNILTMHRAKGLTARAVIVAAAEDQYIPGRAKGDEVDDGRRLLYVSLTRAKHHLFVTYCDRRTGRQTRTGRPAGHDPNTGKAFYRQPRSLTRFLQDAPVPFQAGITYLRSLERAPS